MNKSRRTACESFLFAHPFGNPFSYEAAYALHESQRLGLFLTTFFATSPNAKRRSFPQLKGAPIKRLRREETLRLLLAKFPVGPWNGRHQRWIDWVAKRFDERVSARVTEAYSHVYGYEDSCAASFQRAKDIGVRCVYDLPIGFYKEAANLLQKEVQMDPTLKPFFGVFHESSEKLDRKQQEIELADQIVVASSFTKNSILQHQPELRKKIGVVPYGVRQCSPPSRPTRENGPLKILFAGILGPRKGLHHLFAALQPIPSKEYTLTLAGRWTTGFDRWINNRFNVKFDYVGQLLQPDLWNAYGEADVLAFPSLFEGFGLVILEAMINGLPVIATERTGAPDIYPHGDAGLIVEPGNIPNLTSAIVGLIENRALAAHLGHRAREIATGFTWESYRKSLIDFVLAPC